MLTANHTTATPVTTYSGSTQDPTLLRLAGTFHQFNAGSVLKGKYGRQLTGGPLVPGPWAYTFGLCAVIHSGSDESKAKERADEDARTVEVKDGDLLEIDGYFYRVKVDRGEYLNLKPHYQTTVA
jgi:hypothetical protein